MLKVQKSSRRFRFGTTVFWFSHGTHYGYHHSQGFMGGASYTIAPDVPLITYILYIFGCLQCLSLLFCRMDEVEAASVGVGLSNETDNVWARLLPRALSLATSLLAKDAGLLMLLQFHI